GSSDAAATLKALNKLTSGKRSRDQLVEIGAKLGADIPFFLHGGIARVGGIGEKVFPISPSIRASQIAKHFYPLVIVKPPGGVSTAEAYRLLDELPNRESANATARWPHCSNENDFEEVVYFHFSQVEAVAEALRDAGVKLPHLCGSGSAVFGWTHEPERVAALVEAASVGRVYLAHTTSKGEQ
ncbi:MAG TPA: hypothetical protein VFW40_12395, partial [Capsulimonadaceae bacterium]|nr:hypothetical protein [Capsulimonadaceae bacterium]